MVDDCVRCSSYIDARCIFNKQVIDTLTKVSYYEFYCQWGKRAAMRKFEEQLSDRSYRSIEQALVVWLEDFSA